MGEVSLRVQRKMDSLAIFYTSHREKGRIINKGAVSVERQLSSIGLCVLLHITEYRVSIGFNLRSKNNLV